MKTTSTQQKKKVVTVPRKNIKRMQKSPMFTFAKKATTYLGYTTHFLKDSLIVKLSDPVRIVRCKSGTDIRLGIANLTAKDNSMLADQERALLAAFNDARTGTAAATKFRGLIPSEVEMEETGNDMIFVNAHKAHTTLYNEDRDKVSLSETLPRVSHCRVALAFVGLKVKANEMSPMVRVHQLMLTGNNNEDGVESGNDKCMFTDDDDDGDDME